MNISRINNFDLIRLLAAFQVLILHSLNHFQIELNPVFNFILFFPGVPVFFTISGFLLANSFSNNPDLKNYFINRSLRIFPGLWACILVTIILLISVDVVNSSVFFSPGFFKWLLCQVTFFQYYNPDFLKPWGIGMPNESLWTISVEYQFYILLPFIIWLSKLSNKKIAALSILLIFLMSVGISYFNKHLNQESSLSFLIRVSVFPYLHYFIYGVLGFLLWPYINRFLANKALFWLALYLVYSYLGQNVFHFYSFYFNANIFSWIAYLILSLLVLSAAFTKNELSHKLLRGNDISYGMYIYHMLVVNFIIDNNIKEYKLLITVIVTIVLALLSWKLVERPSLNLKKKTLK